MSIINLVVADPEVAEVARTWGKNFVILSFGAVVIMVVLDAFAAVAAMRNSDGKTDQKLNVDEAPKILEALKGVLEALSKLPKWVAIFLAGYALLVLAVIP